MGFFMFRDINEKEYKRLFNEKMSNPSTWIFRSNLCVESFINDIFIENKFLFRIVFDEEYNILKNENNQNFDNSKKFIYNYNAGDFDHYYAVSFKNNISQIDMPETISGIMNFPYMTWDGVSDFISKVPQGWVVFIINPILMRYDEGSIGIFLTPIFEDNHYMEECNDFIKSRTGYDLFLDYVKRDEVEEIVFNKPDLSLERYVDELKKFGKNKGLSKLLDFWHDNDCVIVESFEYGFNDYKDNLPFSVWHDINFKQIKSIIPFELIHEETCEVLGPFNKFALDKSFKLADTEKGVLQLSDSQINDLIEGKYDFKLID